MDMAPKLPTMGDQHLTTLHANARRLMETGTPVQQSAAAALLPSIEAELQVRNAAKLSKRAEALAAKRASRAAATQAPRGEAGGPAQG